VKIGPVEFHCDFDASKGQQSVWAPPINFTVCWPGFRWSLGVDVTMPSTPENHWRRWFKTCLGQVDDLQVGPKFLVWRMGISRLYWGLCLKVGPPPRKFSG
jgi:hypothetical protein